MKDQTLQVAMDNNNTKVDTPDGKHSIYALASTAFQQVDLPGTNVEKRSSPLQISSNESSKLSDVPKAGVKPITCNIKRNLKSVTSPHYPNSKTFKHSQKLQDSAEIELVWLLAHYTYCKVSDVIILNNETEISSQFVPI